MIKALPCVLLTLLFVGCAPAYRAPPLTLAEKCANDGLIAGGSKGAEASGVVGQFFAGSGSTHSCKRPMTAKHQCEVEANSRAAVAKQTYKAESSQVIAYANDVRWKTYNSCVARQPAVVAPAPVAPPVAAPAPVAPAPAPVPPVAVPAAGPGPAPVSMAPVAPTPSPHGQATGQATAQSMPEPPPSNLSPYRHHSGFTGGFSLGTSLISCDACNDSEGGLGTDLYLGGFANRRTAILFEASFWNESPISAHLETLSVRYYLSPKLWGKGGIGFGGMSISHYGSESGVGITSGLGYEVVQSGNFALDLATHLNVLSIEDSALYYLSFLVGVNWT